MSYPYYEDVQRAYNELRAEGAIGPRTDQNAIEQDKGLITRRGAYYANQRDPTIGLLEKTEGNNSLGYSVDWNVRSTDGVGWDVVTDNGVEASPVNGGPYPADPANIPRWRQPTAELAGLDGNVTPVPPPDGGSTTDARLDAIEEAIKGLASATEALVALVGKQGEEIYHMRTQTWAGDAALAMRMHFGLTCPPMPEDQT